MRLGIVIGGAVADLGIRKGRGGSTVTKPCVIHDLYVATYDCDLEKGVWTLGTHLDPPLLRSPQTVATNVVLVPSSLLGVALVL